MPAARHLRAGFVGGHHVVCGSVCARRAPGAVVAVGGDELMQWQLAMRLQNVARTSLCPCDGVLAIALALLD